MAETFTQSVASTGKDEAFAPITIDDVFLELLPAMVKEEKKATLENLKMIEAAQEQMLAELEEFDRTHRDLSLADLVGYTDRQAGKINVVQYAYRKANPEAKARLSLTASELFDVLNKLLEPLGITYVIKAPEPPKVEEAKPGEGYGSEAPVHPFIPQGYGT